RPGTATTCRASSCWTLLRRRRGRTSLLVGHLGAGCALPRPARPRGLQRLGDGRVPVEYPCSRTFRTPRYGRPVYLGVQSKCTFSPYLSEGRIMTNTDRVAIVTGGSGGIGRA